MMAGTLILSLPPLLSSRSFLDLVESGMPVINEESSLLIG